eukprot:gnl/Chilomastix_cuspidata/4187.p1 GENE.gnl/Chilomastix_cuspidata/4187~~gnl/Chilomastix_cuspidata/4187.p1  ORF type:complete len:1001 (-),score=389.49 gnl/Chilomastix_cuspidata/4187:69-2879(-)
MAHIALLFFVFSLLIFNSLADSFEIELPDYLTNLFLSFNNQTSLFITTHRNSALLIESPSATLICQNELGTFDSDYNITCSLSAVDANVTASLPWAASCDEALETVILSASRVLITRTDFCATSVRVEASADLGVAVPIDNSNHVDALTLHATKHAPVQVYRFIGTSLTLEGSMAANISHVLLDALQATQVYGSIAVEYSVIAELQIFSPADVALRQVYAGSSVVSCGSGSVDVDLSRITESLQAYHFPCTTMDIQTRSGAVSVVLPPATSFDWVKILQVAAADGAVELDLGRYSTPLADGPYDVYVMEPLFHAPLYVFNLAVESDTGRVAVSHRDFYETSWSGLKDCSAAAAACPNIEADDVKVLSRHALGAHRIYAADLISQIGQENWASGKASIFAAAFPVTSEMYFAEGALDAWDVSCGLDQRGLLSCSSKSQAQEFRTFGMVVTGNSSLQTPSPSVSASRAEVSAPYDRLGALSVNIPGTCAEGSGAAGVAGSLQNVIADSVEVVSGTCDAVALESINAGQIVLDAPALAGAFTTQAPYAFLGTLENVGDELLFVRTEVNAVTIQSVVVLPGDSFVVGPADADGISRSIQVLGRGCFTFSGDTLAEVDVSGFRYVELLFEVKDRFAQVEQGADDAVLRVSFASQTGSGDAVAVDVQGDACYITVSAEAAAIVSVPRAASLQPGSALAVVLPGDDSHVILQNNFTTAFESVHFSAGLFEAPSLAQPCVSVAAQVCSVNELRAPGSLNVSATIVRVGILENQWNGLVDVSTSLSCRSDSCYVLLLRGAAPAPLHSVAVGADLLSARGYFRGDEGALIVTDAQLVSIRFIAAAPALFGLGLAMPIFVFVMLTLLTAVAAPASRCMPWSPSRLCANRSLLVISNVGAARSSHTFARDVAPSSRRDPARIKLCPRACRRPRTRSPSQPRSRRTTGE